MSFFRATPSSQVRLDVIGGFQTGTKAASAQRHRVYESDAAKEHWISSETECIDHMCSLNENHSIA